jgi:hypothetical protein
MQQTSPFSCKQGTSPVVKAFNTDNSRRVSPNIDTLGTDFRSVYHHQNLAFTDEDSTGHAFGIIMGCVGSLRASRYGAC